MKKLVTIIILVIGIVILLGVFFGVILSYFNMPIIPCGSISHITVKVTGANLQINYVSTFRGWLGPTFQAISTNQITVRDGDTLNAGSLMTSRST